MEDIATIRGFLRTGRGKYHYFTQSRRINGGGLPYDPALSASILFGGDTQNGDAGNENNTWTWGSNPPIGNLAIVVSPDQPLPNSNVSFRASFKGGTPMFSYSWNFGDGSISTSPNPTHTYSKEGYYKINIRLNDSGGHSANASITLHVYTPLEISAFNATPNPAAIDQPVNFTVNVTGGKPPYTYSWSFGDRVTGGNLSTITHYYTTNGPFTAEVSVTDATGAIGRSYLNITTSLQALASSKAFENSPLTVSFIGGSQGGIPPFTYLWNFGDGTPNSSLQNVVHIFGTSGKYIVSLTVTDKKNVQSVVKLVVQIGEGSGTLPILGSALTFALAVLITATAIGIAWSVSYLRKRNAAKAGNKWLIELSGEHNPPKNTKR